MKKLLKAASIFFVVMALVLTSVCAYASEGTKPLYEKYGYDSNFIYSDEFIAHALKSSVVLVLLNYEATVEYDQPTFDIETIKSELEDIYNEYSDQYSKEEFSSIVVSDMTSNISNYITWGKTKKVPVEASWSGSGVVIDEFGYIATNSHVVSLTDDAKIEACLMHLESGIKDDLEKVIKELSEYELLVTEEQVVAVYEAIVKETANDAKKSNESSSLYVCFPGASGDTTIDKERAYEAKVVAEGVSIAVSNDGATQDAAILEIEKEGLVALKISDTYPEVNTKIVSAGFPGASDLIFQMGGSTKSVLSVTIGTGNISRQVPIDGHDYKALEITTTISGGNSGGPSVDETLMIEGLNTYGNSEDMRYAYMIPAEYVAELSEKFDVGQGEVSITFLTGIQMLQQKYGAAALECFNKAKELNESIPYIDNLIELSKKAPQDKPGEEKSGIDYKMLAIAGIAVAVLAIIIITVLICKKPKKNNSEPTDNLPERFDVFNTIESNTQTTQNQDFQPENNAAELNNNKFISRASSLDNTSSAPQTEIVEADYVAVPANTEGDKPEISAENKPASGRFIGNFNFNNDSSNNNNK